MANAAQSTKLQVGKLSPEDAERLASSFRPIWELDDAPFAQGSALSASDIDALAGGAGVASSIRGTEQKHEEPKTLITTVTPSLPGHVPALDAPKVEISVELDSADLVTATPPIAVAQAQPQPAAAAATVRRPYTPPRAPPQAVNMRDANASGELVPVKKSNTGIIVAVVGVVAIVSGIFIVKSMMSGDKSATTDKANAAQTNNHEEGTRIPPPPEVAATQDNTAPTQTQAPPAPLVSVAKTSDSPITKEFPTTTAAPTHVVAPVHTHVAGGTTHTGGGTTKPPANKPGIVRDNPF